MTTRLTISSSAFRTLVDGLVADPAREAVCPAGQARLSDKREFLLQQVVWGGLTDHLRPIILVRSAADPDMLLPRVLAEVGRLHDRFGVALVLGTGPAGGRIAGMCAGRPGVAKLDELAVIDAGMPLIRFRPSELEAPSAVADLTPWSRTIGALGEVAWRRLTALHYTIIGCGRSGSLMASALAALGARKMTLIDPDVLEVHCLGEMNGVERADVGRFKVTSLASALSRRTCRSGCDFQGLPESILSLPALLAARRADFLICCCDNALARMATAFLAKLYLKPLIDIGTGILHARDGGVQGPMGADVRLILPERCLLCFGGVAGSEQLRAEPTGRDRDGSRSGDSSGWRRQRAGSLQSLNQSAVGFAMRLLEECLRGRVRESVWLQLDFGDSGLPRLQQRTVEPASRCAMCEVTGHGDDGMHLLHSVLSAV